MPSPRKSYVCCILGPHSQQPHCGGTICGLVLPPPAPSSSSSISSVSFMTKPGQSGGSDSASLPGTPRAGSGITLLSKWDFLQCFQKLLFKKKITIQTVYVILGKSQQIWFPIYNCGQDLKNKSRGVVKIGEAVTLKFGAFITSELSP